MKCLRLKWKGGEVKDDDVGRRGAWDESSCTVGRWWWKISNSGGIIWTTMKSPTIHVGTRRAEQEDDKYGRLSASTASLQSWFLTKKQTAVLISASTQVLIAVFYFSASNKVLYRRLHGVRDAASTPGLMSFDPGSVDAVARNFYRLRRCLVLEQWYTHKKEKCNWRNEGITMVKQELEDQLERWDGETP